MKKISILLVEDDDVDAEAVERVIGRESLSCEIVRVRNGVQALERLREERRDRRTRPMIALVDLSMPVMNGIELLDQIRSDPTLRRTIVFVLSHSARAVDRAAAYDRFVAGYVVKGPASELDPVRELCLVYSKVMEFPPEAVA